MAINLKEVAALAVTDYKRFSRKERKEIAKLNGVDFPPQYNGCRPITFTEYLLNFKTGMVPRRLRTSPLTKLSKTEVSE